MQKTLASVDGCGAPSAMHPAGVPVSSMCAPSAKVKAPLWLCSQLVKAPLVQSLSALQGLGGFSKAPPPGTRQKGQKTRTLEMPAPVWNASLLAVPVVNEKEIGRGPMSANTSGGQSWLVGYALVALQVSVPGQSLGTAPTRQEHLRVERQGHAGVTRARRRAGCALSHGVDDAGAGRGDRGVRDGQRGPEEAPTGRVASAVRAHVPDVAHTAVRVVEAGDVAVRVRRAECALQSGAAGAGGAHAGGRGADAGRGLARRDRAVPAAARAGPDAAGLGRAAAGDRDFASRG